MNFIGWPELACFCRLQLEEREQKEGWCLFSKMMGNYLIFHFEFIRGTCSIIMSRTFYALVHYTHPIVKGPNPGVWNLIYKKEKMLLILYAVCLKILLLHFHRSKFEMAKMTERVQSYDTWGKQEYDYSVQVR